MKKACDNTGKEWIEVVGQLKWKYVTVTAGGRRVPTLFLQNNEIWAANIVIDVMAILDNCPIPF